MTQSQPKLTIQVNDIKQIIYACTREWCLINIQLTMVDVDEKLE